MRGSSLEIIATRFVGDFSLIFIVDLSVETIENQGFFGAPRCADAKGDRDRLERELREHKAMLNADILWQSTTMGHRGM